MGGLEGPPNFPHARRRPGEAGTLLDHCSFPELGDVPATAAQHSALCAREIGRRLGPFALAALPIGGYSDYRRHHPNHLSPEEAAQLFEELDARLMVPMHWGTFDLNREPFREPPDRLLAEALRRGLEERIALLSPGQTIVW